MSSENVTIELSEAAALVLFDYLARFNEQDHDDLGEAEQRVLFDIEALLEQRLAAPLSADYRALLERARAELVADDDD